jgi:CheY-like chemotaxis protein
MHPYNGVSMMDAGMAVNTNQPHVLVVDDEAAIRDMIQFALERAKMQVLTAADAQEALLRINEARPDIILMDWMMPGVSGIELTRRLRRDSYTEDIPIIMLTAGSPRTTRWRGSRRAPTITSSSRFHRASCWRGFARCCVAAARRTTRVTWPWAA